MKATVEVTSGPNPRVHLQTGLPLPGLGTPTVSAADWGAGEDVRAGDMRTHNELIWVARVDHTTSSISEPGVGQAWVRDWKPWVVEGYHYWFDHANERGTEALAGRVSLGNGSLLSDWAFAYDYIISELITSTVGGGATGTGWEDGVPYGNPATFSAQAYTAGEFTYAGSTVYKCYQNTDGTGKEPGVAADWEDYWFEWPRDYRVGWAVTLTGGTYSTSKVWRWPPLTSIHGNGVLGYGNFVTIQAHDDFDAPYLVEGCYRTSDPFQAHSCFYTNLTNLELDGRNRVTRGVVRAMMSHGSTAENLDIRGFFGVAGLVLGESCDDYALRQIIFSGSGIDSEDRRGICILAEGTQKATTWDQITMTEASVGMWVSSPEGVVVINPELENVGIPFVFGGPGTDTNIFSTYSAATDYEACAMVQKNGSYFVCVQANGPSSTLVDPEDTANAYGFWFDVTDFNNGACISASLVGGSFRRPAYFAPRWAGIVRAGNSPYRQFTATNVSQSHSGTNDVDTVYTSYRVIKPDAGLDDVYEIPIFENELEEQTNYAFFHTDLREEERNRHRWVNISSGSNYAKDEGMGAGLVAFDNPGPQTAAGTDTVTLVRGLYYVEVVSLVGFGGLSLTLSDAAGVDIAPFKDVASDTTGYYYHAGGDVTITTADDGTPGDYSVSVLFRPRRS